MFDEAQLDLTAEPTKCYLNIVFVFVVDDIVSPPEDIDADPSDALTVRVKAQN